MHRMLKATALLLALTSTAFARKCCVCCPDACETPAIPTLPPANSAIGCDDVRQAPTCRRIKPALCRPRIASGVEPEMQDTAQSTRESIYQSEKLRYVIEIWEKAWMLEMPDIATPYRTQGGVI